MTAGRSAFCALRRRRRAAAALRGRCCTATVRTHGRAPTPAATKASRRAAGLGAETLRYGVAKLTAAERLGVALHPRIAQRIEQQFLLGSALRAILFVLLGLAGRTSPTGRMARPPFGPSSAMGQA